MDYSPPNKAGQHKDGSITLCPQAAAVLRDMMSRRGGGGIVIPIDFKAEMNRLADVIYEHQGLEFEMRC
jgi:hypothetical protein